MSFSHCNGSYIKTAVTIFNAMFSKVVGSASLDFALLMFCHSELGRNVFP